MQKQTPFHVGQQRRPRFRHVRLLIAILLAIVFAFIFLMIFYSKSDFNINWQFHATTVRLVDLDTLLNNSLGDSASAPHQKSAIVSVLDGPEVMGEFQFAMSTIHCYCQRHHSHCSHIVLFSPNKNVKSAKNDQIGHQLVDGNEGCEPIEDFMFRRHCLLANWMVRHPEFEWVLFLDADIGVVNPEHSIGEFVTDRPTELVFFDRMFNFEIMAGKNTPFVHRFLHSWANYFFRLPNSFHGTDNGAIHALIMENYATPNSKNACQHLWEKSRNFAELFLYEACVRFNTNWKMAEGNKFEGGRLRVLPKGRGSTRDSGLTGTRFSRRDFMLHGWKKSTHNRSIFNPWTNPFHSDQHFDQMEKCANESVPWKYKAGYYVEKAQVEEMLNKLIQKSRTEYVETLMKLGLAR